MNIKMNTYINQAVYMKAADERASKSYGGGKNESEAKHAANKDTVSISVEGQRFVAEHMTSDSEMEKIKITSDLDSFRSAVGSLNEPLPVNWEATVDPYGTFWNFAKVESRLRQLTDPTVSHNDEDMEKAADAYAKSKIDQLIEKKKAMLASGMAKSTSEEYNEYKMAYDAYHSENGERFLEMMTNDTKKLYNIYKNIIDGTAIPIEDEEFLALHNQTMYRGAKGEYIRRTQEL